MNRRQTELLILLSRFIATGLAGYSLFRPLRPHHWRHFAKSHASETARKALDVFHAEIQIEGKENLVSPKRSGRLFLCNHHSYFDGLIVASTVPGVFVTSVEAQSDLVQGLLAKIAGSLFVERRNKSRLVQDIDDVGKALKAGFSVAIFPEGRTGDGTQLLPFKSSLIQAAIDAEAEIIPLCLNYLRINDQPVHAGNRDLVFYYGGMEFLGHLKKLLKQLYSLSAELHVLTPISVNKNTHRREVGEKVRLAILEKFRPIEPGLRSP